ncbi:MAG: hypothetical protein Tsb0020_19450 [Haliangiales bacterium]
MGFYFSSHIANYALLSIVMVSANAGLGCTEPVEEPGFSSELLGQREQAVVETNGFTLNGFTLNGFTLNGFTLNGFTLNGFTLNGFTLNGLSVADVALDGSPLSVQGTGMFEAALSYFVECALPAGESVTIYDHSGNARLMGGSLGLAPEWASGPLSERGQALVSACLAARVNRVGRTVNVSLRHPTLPISAVERDMFQVHEGAFWGSFFGDTPALYSCRVDGGGLSGRECADSNSCGFTYVGECADVCAVRDPILGYSQCGGDASDLVINTFLNLGERVSFGDRSACVRGEGGSLACWGQNDYGQLGDGTSEDRSAPVTVDDLGPTVAEATSGEHQCVRVDDGSMWCWGKNDRGQLGDGSNSNRSDPVHVAEDAATIAVGKRHTCVVKTDGALWCWGGNEHGQVGVGEASSQVRAPTRVEAIPARVGRLAIGSTAEHSCVVTVSGEVWCWGRNDSGQLGDGGVEPRATPAPIVYDREGAAFGDATDMCVAEHRSCARKSDDTLWCWGGGETSPVKVAENVAPHSVSCASTHVCYVDTGTKVRCFGDNQFGQLGRPAKSNSPKHQAKVKAVPSVKGAASVNVNGTSACAQRSDGGLLCWGQDPTAASEEPLYPVSLSHHPRELVW